MSYLVFARKWRPQTFEEVVGQEHVTTTLKNAILQNRVAHAYLFSGPRGVGKTTTARIFAKALNCQSAQQATPAPCNKCESCIEITEGRSLDVIEIDGASNRGIEEIRQLRENVKFGPSKGRCKVYIIDEVHQITADGFNALLKTLEEPPPYIKFVFATTHRHKVIPTILSRCQRFDFKRIPVSQLVDKLKEITIAEKLNIGEEALFIIARAADGSVRDAESILDQLVSFSQDKIDTSDVVSMLGSVEQEVFFQTTKLIIEKNAEAALQLINKFIDDGKDLLQFVNGLLEHFRNLAIAKVHKNPHGLIDLPRDAVDRIIAQSREAELQEILYLFNVLSNTQESMRKSGFARIQLEMAMIKLIKKEPAKDFLKAAPRPDKVISDAKPPVAARPVEPQKPIPAQPLPPRAGVDTRGGNADYAVGLTQRQDNTATLVQESVLTDAKIEGNIVSINEIQSAWPAILQKIKSEKISAALFLMEGKPSQVYGRTLIIDFPATYVFYKEALERNENKSIIEKYLKQVLGKDIKIKLEVIDIISAAKINSAPAAAAEQQPKSEAQENSAAPAGGSQPKDAGKISGQAEPIIQAAFEIFKARVVRKQ